MLAMSFRPSLRVAPRMAARSMVRLSFLVASAVALLKDKLSLTPLCRLPSKKLAAYVVVVAGYSYGHIAFCSRYMRYIAF
jgi:hypothetical protein